MDEDVKKKSQEKKKFTSGKRVGVGVELEQKSVESLSTTTEVPLTPAEVPERNMRYENGMIGQEQSVMTSKEDCRPRPFDQEVLEFKYVKHSVLPPESGPFDLISPCHEFKSLASVAQSDRTILQAKFAQKVLKFATGCMNIRTNGTIHFGVMDNKENAGYMHGEIIGIPVKDKDIYVDALDYIEKSFSSNKEHVRQCVRPPRFIEVMDRESTEKKYVVEVDIVPSIGIVKGKVYSVCLPNFNKSTNKVEFEKKKFLRRVGSKTEPVSEKDKFFFKCVKDRDAQREEAEKGQFFSAPDFCQDLGRKLKMLMTSGKKFIEKEKWFILVTNKFSPDDLCNIDWLLNMNLFCVFDFDPDSKISGLCSKYLQHHAANMHSLQSYRISGDKSIKEFTSSLHLFDQTSWIFCNGCTDFKGNETPCDEIAWIDTKVTIMQESVSLICKQILPKGTFQVIFLLTSPVEKPLLHTFNEFFTDMEGHEDIICICESQKNFHKWQSFTEVSCGTETVNNCSVVGMKMSHVNATLQQIQPVKAHASKHLPVFVKGTYLLETQADSLESSYVKYVGVLIRSDAYQEVSNLLNDTLKWNADQTPVKWKNSKYLRCAVVKPSYSAADVVQHAVELREYKENDPQKCLPVLLLIEDSDNEYLQNKQTQSSLAKSGKADNIVLDIDSINSLFSLLIEHVCENGKIQPFFSQQLDRLQAKDRAETAAKQLPINSYILNTKGQVYKKCIQAKCKAIEDVKHVWESFHDRLKKIHKSMQDTLEWISQDLSYFQTDIGADEEETRESPEEQIRQLLTLSKKICRVWEVLQQKNKIMDANKLSPTEQ